MNQLLCMIIIAAWVGVIVWAEKTLYWRHPRLAWTIVGITFCIAMILVGEISL